LHLAPGKFARRREKAGDAHTLFAIRFQIPGQTLRAFAEAFINWDAADVAAQMARLAEASIGQARAEMALAAAQTRGDTQLAQGGIANAGTVEAVAPLPGAPGRDVAGASIRYVVVTREATTATDSSAYEGLDPAWHVTIATVTALPGRRWVVSDWQPES